MQTDKLIAVFDCKQYNAKLPKEQWRVLSNDETVQLTITYSINQLPDDFKQEGQPDEFLRLYTSKAEKESAAKENRAAVSDRAAVRFKVGANCKWFDKYGKATKRPDNTELDGKRYEVVVDFARKPRDLSNKLAPCGYWANAIMFREVEDSPFAGKEFEKDDTDAEPEPTQEPAPAPQPSYPEPTPAQREIVRAMVGADDEENLPF